MGKKCLKCGYERKDSDLAPDYECPKCGAVYSKVKMLEKNETSAVQTSEKINESPERNFISYSRRYKQVVFVATDLMRGSLNQFMKVFRFINLRNRDSQKILIRQVSRLKSVAFFSGI